MLVCLFFGDDCNRFAVFVDVSADFLESRFFQEGFELLFGVNLKADFGKIRFESVARLRFVDD